MAFIRSTREAHIERAGAEAVHPRGDHRVARSPRDSDEGRPSRCYGRSRIVGLPIALLLLHRHATVTICHSRTKDLPAVAREADILIAAIGRTGMVDRSYIKPARRSWTWQ